MAIIINIDVMLAKRKMSVTELAEKVGITMANVSILKNGKAKAIRLSTLEAICKALECQPGDILEYKIEPDFDAATQAPRRPVSVGPAVGDSG
jgi:putative transcriptional regulator